MQIRLGEWGLCVRVTLFSVLLGSWEIKMDMNTTGSAIAMLMKHTFARFPRRFFCSSWKGEVGDKLWVKNWRLNQIVVCVSCDTAPTGDGKSCNSDIKAHLRSCHKPSSKRFTQPLSASNALEDQKEFGAQREQLRPMQPVFRMCKRTPCRSRTTYYPSVMADNKNNPLLLKKTAALLSRNPSSITLHLRSVDLTDSVSALK